MTIPYKWTKIGCWDHIDSLALVDLLLQGIKLSLFDRDNHAGPYNYDNYGKWHIWISYNLII